MTDIKITDVKMTDVKVRQNEMKRLKKSGKTLWSKLFSIKKSPKTISTQISYY